MNFQEWRGNFLPKQYEELNYIDQYRSEMVISASFLLGIPALPTAGLSYYLGQNTIAILLLIVGLSLTLIPLLQRATGKVHLACNGFIFFLLAGITSLCVAERGLDSPFVMFFIIVPLLAFLLTDGIKRYTWILSVALACLVLYGMETFNYPFPAKLNASNVSFLQFATLILLIFAGSVVISLYEKNNTEAHEQLNFAIDAIGRSEKRYRAILQNAPIALWSFNQEGMLEFAEGRALDHLQTSTKQTLNLNVTAESYFLPNFIHTFSQVSQGEEVIDTFERQGKTFEARYVPIQGENGEFDGMVGIATDISIYQNFEQVKELNEELKIARDKASKANQTKSQFLASMSHELRTPLNAIMGYSELLREDAESDGNRELVGDLNKIHSSGSHLLSLINDILDLSKVESGKMEIHPEEFEVEQLLEEVRTTMLPLAAKNNNTMKITLPAPIGKMFTDITRLRQILINLLSNACKFTENGHVALTAHIEGHNNLAEQNLVFQVTDTGIGMTPEQLERSFDAFLQADSRTARKYGGTGLGLALCKRFSQLLGGEIIAESEKDVGSTFTVKIPRFAQLQNAKDIKVTGKFFAFDFQNAKPQNERPIVLVIDDDDAVHELLKRILQKEGYEVVAANSGKEGLLLAKKYNPTAITLDVMMPGLSGWDVLTMIKSDPALRDIPVIMLSIVDDIERGYALGVSDYLTKPIQRNLLVETLKRYKKRKEIGRVLIVEDDPGTRELLYRTLIRSGWEVQQAQNGLIALDLLEKGSKPALILLDLMMPEMDGFTFLERVRLNPEWSQIPIIVLTAMELSELDLTRLSSGVEKIIKKGAYSLEQLERELHKLLSSHIQLPHKPNN